MKNNSIILIVDDDPSVRRIIEYKLIKRGYKTLTAADGTEALELLRKNRVDVLLTDVRMPKLSGTELLAEAQRLDKNLAVILITAHATVQQAVDAMKSGALDYITKPFEDEHLFDAIERAIRYRERTIKSPSHTKPHLGSTQELLGQSEAFQELLQSVEKIASSDATILLTGESGTGKELVARTIHKLSPREKEPFVPVNCAAIPKDLIESELFGYKKGAFTGANKDKKGKFQLADGGTLLLDEIGDLAAPLQATLLRVLQEGVIDPIGGEHGIPVNVRLIAATNVTLMEKVQAGDFREDLYYRLNVIPIHVPPLRERRADIPLLVHSFIRKFTSEDVAVHEDLLEALKHYPWPGNIRELQNLIERLVVLRSENKLSLNDLPPQYLESPRISTKPTNSGMETTLDEAQTAAIVNALETTNWNQSKAAKRLNIPRHVLIYRMKKLGIKNPGSN